MIKLEKLEKGEFFEDAFLVSYRYNKDYLNKMRSLKYKRYVPDKKAWEIPSSELKHLVDLFGVDDINVNAKYLEGLVEKEESKADEAPEDIKERLKDIKPIVNYPFKTKPFPHQIEAFNRGYECKNLLLADDQGLGKTKESIDIAVARKGEIGKCLIVCGVNSVKYNWKKEVSVHSNESCVVIDGKTVDKRIQQIDQWLYGSPYFGIINIESLRNEKIMDRIYVDCKLNGVGDTKVIPAWDGGGTVKLIIINSDFDKASDTLVSEVQEAMDPLSDRGNGSGIAPIGHTVTVVTVKEVPITVSVNIVYKEGYSWSRLGEDIKAAIEAYLLEMRKDWANQFFLSVRITQVEARLLKIEGIVDISDTKINGVADNFTLASDEIPVPSETGVVVDA